MNPCGRSDAELVGDCLANERDAFAEIVSRYQTLVCSLAYSATGDRARSEDLAQDTFLAVWRQMSELREPAKLRAWVCGIARHRIQDSIRRRYREPTYRAAPLDDARTAPAPEEQPSDQVVNKDEEGIVWRALEQIPESYREPLILFHRENQSVERVAALLGLSEDAVKQRLVRGRKLLQAEVETVVEGTLRRTVPGRAFTLNIMGLLPAATLATNAGGVAAKMAVGASAMAKGSTAGGIPGWFSTLVHSPLAVLPLVLLERKKGLAQEAEATSDEERILAKTQRRVAHVVVLVCAVILTVLASWYKKLDRAPWFAPLISLPVVLLLTANYVHALRVRWHIWKIWAKSESARAAVKWEFRSRRTWLGLPLVHLRLQASNAPVKAWIAVGNVAHGAFVAAGTVAVAPVSIGIFGVGFFSVGVMVAGGVAIGAQAVGMLAVGVVALGWMASGVIAFGWNAAYGCAAYAGNFAGSPAGFKKAVAFAVHADDAAAREFFTGSRFFSWTGECAHAALQCRFLPAVFLGGLACWIILQRRRSLAARAPAAGRISDQGSS